MTPFEVAVADHLDWLECHGYSPLTIASRRRYLAAFTGFCAETGIYDPQRVTPAVLDAYQRHLARHRTQTGRPLSFRTQAQRLIPIRVLFTHLARTGTIDTDPTVALVLPKAERRLPEAVLSVDEVENILAGPDTTTPTGLRDRAILEVLYSTAIRRAELVNLRVSDIDHQRHTVFVRAGKGHKDRHVPIGTRALSWTLRYTDHARPQLAVRPDDDTLFLAATGNPLAKDVLTRAVTAYVHAGAPGKKGSCHLFRHTAATLMLDNGADVRLVAELLGHAKLETTMIYTRVSLQRLREVHAQTHPAERPRQTA